MDCRVFKQKIGLLNHLNSQQHWNCCIPNILIPPWVVERLNKLPEVKPPAVVDGAGAGIGASASLVPALGPQPCPLRSHWEAFILLPSSNATLAERAKSPPISIVHQSRLHPSLPGTAAEV